jgi:hypothetical protein
LTPLPKCFHAVWLDKPFLAIGHNASGTFMAIGFGAADM